MNLSKNSDWAKADQQVYTIWVQVHKVLDQAKLIIGVDIRIVIIGEEVTVGKEYREFSGAMKIFCMSMGVGMYGYMGICQT